MRKTLLIAAVLAIVAGAFVAAACGGDDDEPNAAEIYEDAGKKMAGLKSFHVTSQFEEEERLEIDVAPPDRSHFKGTFTDDTGNAEVFEAIRIGDQAYQKGLFFDPGSEDWFESPEVFGPAPDFTAFFSRLWTDVSDLTYAGEEDLDGAASHRLRGTITAELAMLFDSEEPPGESITLELLVGKKDSLVHELRRLNKEGEVFDALTLSRFDEEISIEPPAAVLPATEFFKRLIEATPADQLECIRGKIGDAAFEEVRTGQRLPTQEELDLGDECVSE